MPPAVIPHNLGGTSQRGEWMKYRGFSLKMQDIPGTFVVCLERKSCYNPDKCGKIES